MMQDQILLHSMQEAVGFVTEVSDFPGFVGLYDKDVQLNGKSLISVLGLCIGKRFLIKTDTNRALLLERISPYMV